jgi:glucose-6-phosphate isomerase
VNLSENDIIAVERALHADPAAVFLAEAIPRQNNFHGRKMKIMINWKNFDELAAYDELKKTSPVNLKEVMSGESGAERVRKYSVPMAEGFTYNYAAKAVDDDILAVLVKLADEAQLAEKYEDLYNGDVINTGEKRLVLHQLCRGQLGKDVIADGVNKRDFYVEQQKRIADFANKVHAGEIANEKGEKFTTAVQIGIGGSDLGPRAMYLALENWAKKNGKFKMEAKFISNVDPDDASAVLASVDVEHALFILVSKSGTTLETLTNQSFVMDALKKAGLDPAKHMIAVTSETSPLAHSDAYLDAFFMDDYIGGRYSSSSAVGGAVLSLAFGPDVFADFLEGAAAEDRMAKEKDPLKNADMLDALIGVYERNILGMPATAVLPYSQALSRFPAHLQQLDMESNGKSVNRFGQPVDYVTGPIIFGEPGTNGQHSFYQLLHQGKTIVPLQFVGYKNSQLANDVVIEGTTSQQKLKANVAAQIVAFACGKSDENLNKNFEGGRPSSIIIGDQVNPRTLGALLAHFENKVMFQGFIWNVNSFDQEGVQLGKKLAKRVLARDTEGALTVYSDLLGI